MSMTPKELKKIGKDLFGTRWQTELAREIGMNERSIRYMSSGDWPISGETEQKIFDLVERKVKQLAGIAQRKGVL